MIAPIPRPIWRVGSWCWRLMNPPSRPPSAVRRCAANYRVCRSTRRIEWSWCRYFGWFIWVWACY
jgi:hypothetical protein